jgi:hypothetical protein
VSASQAQAGFGKLAGEQGLFSALPGSGEDTIDQGTQVAAGLENNAAAQKTLSRRQAQRLAPFQGGGAVNVGNTGATGLGSAATS